MVALHSSAYKKISCIFFRGFYSNLDSIQKWDQFGFLEFLKICFRVFFFNFYILWWIFPFLWFPLNYCLPIFCVYFQYFWERFFCDVNKNIFSKCILVVYAYKKNSAAKMYLLTISNNNITRLQRDDINMHI